MAETEELTVADVIDHLMISMEKWMSKIEDPNDDEIKQFWIEFFTFTPPESFLRLLTLLPDEFGLSIGYFLQFIEPREAMIRTFCYTESFQEFFSSTQLIPILDHGTGRTYDLYDCKTGAIIQFNIIDPPTEWFVLSTSFEDSALKFYKVLQDTQVGIPPPESIYDDSTNFKPLLDVFPERANELNEILPQPLVLRTHQPGTWQIDKPSKIHQIIQNNLTDDITELHAHLEANPQDLRLKTMKLSEPLHEACRLGRYNCLIYLIDRLRNVGNDVSNTALKEALAAQNKEKSTPLIVACENLYDRPEDVLKCVNYLLSLGSDLVEVNCANDEGQTPLHLLASTGYVYFVKKLIELHANISQCDHEKFGANTPLHLLCRIRGGTQHDQQYRYQQIEEIPFNGPFEITQRSSLLSLLLLIHAGADVNSITTDGNTALHLLMWGSGMEDNSKMVEILCHYGADVNAKTKHGVSVLDSGFAKEKYLDLLSRYGAKSTEDPNTALTAVTHTTRIVGRQVRRPLLRTANAVIGMTANEAVENYTHGGEGAKKKKRKVKKGG